MAASLMLRFHFTDGGTWEARMNVWVYRKSRYSDAWRFGACALVSPGDVMRPDGPDTQDRVVARVERLPYKNAGQKPAGR